MKCGKIQDYAGLALSRFLWSFFEGPPCLQAESTKDQFLTGSPQGDKATK
jgi:hypothetical protein